MPSGDGPATVVRIFDAELITAAHETLDVIGAEAKVTVPHGVYVFFILNPVSRSRSDQWNSMSPSVRKSTFPV